MITAVLCLFMHPIIGYAQEKTNGNSKNAEKKGHGKILIVFFSHTGENYAVGNIEVGNTKMVADYIRDVTGGDEFEQFAVKLLNVGHNLHVLDGRSVVEGDETYAFAAATGAYPAFNADFCSEIGAL